MSATIRNTENQHVWDLNDDGTVQLVTQRPVKKGIILDQKLVIAGPVTITIDCFGEFAPDGLRDLANDLEHFLLSDKPS